MVKSAGIQLAPPGHAFKGWHYYIVQVLAINLDMTDKAYFNIGYSITLVDEDFLARIALNAKIQYCLKLVDIKGISDDMHQTTKFV
jgi:hypothetical protein